MKATVRKWGNGAAVREEAGRQKTSDLDDLLKGVTRKNLHEPIELGSPEGKEVW